MTSENTAPDGWEDKQWVQYNDLKIGAVVWLSVGFAMFLSGFLWSQGGMNMPTTDLAEMTIDLGQMMLGVFWATGGLFVMSMGYSILRLSHVLRDGNQ